MKKLIGCSILGVAACVASGGEWSFSGGAITDGNWTLPAQFNSTAKTLTITGSPKGSPRSGSGLLDLDDPVVDGVEIQKVYFWNQLFEYDKADITEFRCNRYWQPGPAPDNMTWALFRYNQSVTNISLGGLNGVHLWADTACGCSNLVSLVLDFPNQTNISSSAFSRTPKLASVTIRSSKRMTLPNGLFENRTALTSVTLDLPQNTEIPDALFRGCTALSDLNLNLGKGEEGLTRIGSLAFNSCSKLVGDISTFCPPSVEVVATRAFEGCSGLTGSLVLTNLQHLGDAAFAWTKIQDVELRGPITQAEWKNTTWGDQGARFSGVTTLTNAVFDLPNVTSLYVNDFFNCWALKSVYFWRKPFRAESLRYLLNGKGLSQKTCTLYVSSQQWPWSERAASGCRALTAEEKTDARRPERCLGMCDVGDPKVPEGDGKWTQQRLAWFARWPSPYDVPLGGIFIVR